MVSLGQLNEFDFGILGVVLLQVGKELFVVTGMNSGGNSIGALREHAQHAVINEVVDQDDSLAGTPHEV